MLQGVHRRSASLLGVVDSGLLYCTYILRAQSADGGWLAGHWQQVAHPLVVDASSAEVCAARPPKSGAGPHRESGRSWHFVLRCSTFSRRTQLPLCLGPNDTCGHMDLLWAQAHMLQPRQNAQIWFAARQACRLLRQPMDSLFPFR